MNRLIKSTCFPFIASLFFFVSHLNAQDIPALTQEEFGQCIASLQLKAGEAGVSENRIQKVLGSAQFLPKVISYDRNQPEFVKTFPGYLSKRVNDWRITKGREMAKKHKALLSSLTKKYGIPAHYLVSFWGLETNFGSYKGKMPIIDSLATLACDKRRSAFFTKELILALRLMDRENIANEAMVGSWAGAMGHTQFMPSAYTQYAVDGDGDGKIDLWNSEEDALTSAANFLQNLGWQTGIKWGREVRLSEEVVYQLTGRDNGFSVTEWASKGVTRADGSNLGSSEIKGSLLVPSGHEGPAFLVYKNFNVILGWNNSEYYAIAVGYLADRIIGKPKLVRALPQLEDYAIAELKGLQESLNRLGFDVGDADGILGPATRKGVRQFQSNTDMIADGFPDKEVFDAVNLALEATQTSTL